jgi:hypothetical protein
MEQYLDSKIRLQIVLFSYAEEQLFAAARSVTDTLGSNRDELSGK